MVAGGVAGLLFRTAPWSISGVRGASWSFEGFEDAGARGGGSRVFVDAVESRKNVSFGSIFSSSWNVAFGMPKGLGGLEEGGGRRPPNLAGR